MRRTMQGTGVSNILSQQHSIEIGDQNDAGVKELAEIKDPLLQSIQEFIIGIKEKLKEHGVTQLKEIEAKYAAVKPATPEEKREKYIGQMDTVEEQLYRIEEKRN